MVKVEFKKNIGQGLMFDRFFFTCTEDRYMTSKWIAEHIWELHYNHKFLVMAEAYLSATFGQNTVDAFDLCLHRVFLVCFYMDGPLSQTKDGIVLWEQGACSL